MMQAIPEASVTLAGFAAGGYPSYPGISQNQGSAADFGHDRAAWALVADRLVDLSELGPGWDGDDAPPPPKFLLASARKLAASLRTEWNWPPPSRAVATFDGTVVFEWQSSGLLIELEVVRPGRAEGTIHQAGRRTRHMTIGW